MFVHWDVLEDAWRNGHVAILETSVSLSDLENTSVCHSKIEQQGEFYLLGESLEKGWGGGMLFFFSDA